jgi:hypothetical protein
MITLDGQKSEIVPDALVPAIVVALTCPLRNRWTRSLPQSATKRSKLVETKIPRGLFNIFVLDPEHPVPARIENVLLGLFSGTLLIRWYSHSEQYRLPFSSIEMEAHRARDGRDHCSLEPESVHLSIWILGHSPMKISSLEFVRNIPAVFDETDDVPVLKFLVGTVAFLDQMKSDPAKFRTNTVSFWSMKREFGTLDKSMVQFMNVVASGFHIALEPSLGWFIRAPKRCISHLHWLFYQIHRLHEVMSFHAKDNSTTRITDEFSIP